uniref:Uncharacterized protein n=1 Tax=Erwinia amylovora ATCC BAA-2158 TaxID=889211 RepID=E5B8X1_ERWAM|nr:hypothetical protein predicted by Glimmer/Critica [Erwinia amylovora ATCC BAA-2158]
MLFRPHFWRVRFFLAVALKKFKKNSSHAEVIYRRVSTDW